MSADMATIRAITTVIASEADRLGRGWSWQGLWGAVQGALDEDGRTPAQVTTAGLSAARDERANTPGSIRWASRYTVPPGRADAQSGPPCAICARPEGACVIATSKTDVGWHPFTADAGDLKLAPPGWKAAAAARMRGMAA